MDLKSAHKGYLYQDLFTAYLIAKNLLLDDFEILVDIKEHSLDCFDDLTIKVGGTKIKFQLKHSENNDKLNASDFNTSSGKLNINSLLTAYQEQPDRNKTLFVIASNKLLPSGANWLKMSGRQSNKNFEHSSLFVLNSNAIFADKKDGGWSILDKQRYGKDIFESFLKKLSIELLLPNASLNLFQPGAFEQEFLKLLRLKLGIGTYPNDNVAVEDVAARIILIAAKARTDKTRNPITKKRILADLGLNIEYGYVLQQFPFVESKERIKIPDLQALLINACKKDRFVILKGFPGSGKSHQFDDLYKNLTKEGVVAIKHYCYLEPTDPLVQKRILTETMFGNFCYQLHESYQEIGKKIEGLFAGDRVKVEKFIELLVKNGKRVVLMIDGLDHIERVINQNQLSPLIIQSFINEICNIHLPPNTCIFVSTQTSIYLDKILIQEKPTVIELPKWDNKIIRSYCNKRGIKNDFSRFGNIDYGKNFIEHLVATSEGNALYVNYIVNQFIESLRSNKAVSLDYFFSSLPRINNDIGNYYGYLLQSVSQNDFDIVRTIALLDFSITRSELHEIFPPIQIKRTNQVLSKIRPILKENFSIGGIRIYHESFRRFILESAQKEKNWSRDVYSHIVGWLDKKGVYKFAKSYRYLFSYFQRSGNYQGIYNLVGPDFVAKSLFHLYPPKVIKNNLMLAASVAAQQRRWDVLARIAELNRSLHTYVHERAETIQDAYLDTFLNIFGSDAFAEKLVFDGQPVFDDIEGLRLCQICEFKGGVPPWDYYGNSILDRKISIQNDNDRIFFQEVQSAYFLKVIRSKPLDDAIKIFKRILSSNARRGFGAERTSRLLLEQICYVYELDQVFNTFIRLDLPQVLKCPIYIELAEILKFNGKYQEAKKLANIVLSNTTDSKLLVRCLQVDNTIFPSGKLLHSFEQSFASSAIVNCQDLYGDRGEAFAYWYNYVEILSYRNRNTLEKVSKSIRIDGWFRAWLIFVLNLSLIEQSKGSVLDKERKLREVIDNLIPYTHPFTGSPRACDLYYIRYYSLDSFKRCLRIITSLENLNKVLLLLQRISKETTTTLEGSPSGPLTGEDLSDILLEDLKTNKRPPETQHLVKKFVLDELARSRDYARFYDIQAEHSLNYANALASVGEKTKARKVFLKACVFLGAYGFRKDVTLWEVIEPIKFIAAKDKKFALQCFSQTYPLVYLVRAHTDGAETKWGLNIWFRNLFEVDKKIAIDTLINVINGNPHRDWRIERITEDFCDNLIGQLQPTLLADLYETLYLEDYDRTDFGYRIKLLEIIFRKGPEKKAFDYSQNLAYKLFRWRYPYTDKQKYIDILQQFLKCSEKLNFPINDVFRNHFLQEIHKFKPSSDPLAVSSLPGNKSKSSVVFNGRMSFAQIRSIIETNTYDILINKDNQSILRRYLLRLIIQGEENKAKDITRYYFRRISYSDMKKLMPWVRFFERKGYKKFAAFISMLCFANSRDSSGWYKLGDSNSHIFAIRAYTLSRPIADKTLGEEIVYSLDSSPYAIGITRHLIEFFAQNSSNSVSKKIWQEAYKVIEYRIPATRNLITLKLTLKLKGSVTENPTELVQKLITVRNKIRDT